MKRKLLSALLCLSMAAGALTGCGSENGDSQAENASGAQDSVAGQSSEEASGGTESSEEGSGEENVPQGEPTVIRWGHNWSREMDTSFRDPVTGEPSLSPEDMEARLYAEQQVLEKYNCVIEFVDYPSDLTECILQSVLAGDPVADVVRLTNGTQGQVLAQNQSLIKI